MKINRKHLVFIWLTLATLASPALVYADSINVVQSNPLSNNIINKHKTPNANKSTSVTTRIHTQKNILVNDSRDLSAFFILGIIINIIMVITFGWWFSKEWRSLKK